MQKAEKMQELRVFAAQIRLETLKTIGSLGFGHVGGSMSVADALAVLYGGVMNIDPKNPRWEDRDWCVMSKGHAGPAMYATLGLKGFYPVEEAYTLNKPHTNFPSHTDRQKTPGVDLTTGSLGQGMSTAVGAALGNKMDGRDSHVFVFVGDGECDEGQLPEPGPRRTRHRRRTRTHGCRVRPFCCRAPPPTAVDMPCPSEPVVRSTPGVSGGRCGTGSWCGAY